MNYRYFLFFTALFSAVMVGMWIILAMAHEERKAARKRRARDIARKNAQARARRAREEKSTEESLRAEASRREARREFYEDMERREGVKEREAVLDEVKFGKNGNLLAAKGHVG